MPEKLHVSRLVSQMNSHALEDRIFIRIVTIRRAHTGGSRCCKSDGTYSGNAGINITGLVVELVVNASRGQTNTVCKHRGIKADYKGSINNLYVAESK